MQTKKQEGRSPSEVKQNANDTLTGFLEEIFDDEGDKEEVVETLNKAVDLPKLTEMQEAILFERMVEGVVFGYTFIK